MKKPKRLIGYIKYDETDYPFEFDEEAFSLLLFPPTVDAWNHTSSILNLFSGFKGDERKHELIDIQNNLFYFVPPHRPRNCFTISGGNV